ncbi:MAG: hypothetical protein ABI678_06925 [Kofleriaceae bacterium]
MWCAHASMRRQSAADVTRKRRPDFACRARSRIATGSLEICQAGILACRAADDVILHAVTAAGIQRLAAVISASFDNEHYRADLASIVGARSDASLAIWIDELCRAHLGHEVGGARFACKSVGAVFGLTLADDSAVVLKLFPSTCDEAALRAIEACLARINQAGFPSPRPLAPLFQADQVWGAFYELIDGTVLDAHRVDVRRTLAHALAALTEIVIAVDPTGLPTAPTRRHTLWGPPHRVGIDLGAAGGEWIDARAAAAQHVVRESALPLIAAHLDWGTKNALFVDGKLRAILDWDSLMMATEAELVGRAAAQFTAQWAFPARLTPTRAEASAFAHEYEAARGRRFTPVEQRVANASADYLMAEIARQTFSGPDCADDEYRALLRETAATPLISFG